MFYINLDSNFQFCFQPKEATSKQFFFGFSMSDSLHVSLWVKRSLMFPRRWWCSRRRRPHRMWRSWSSRASGTCSSRSSTCSASDRCVHKSFDPPNEKSMGLCVVLMVRLCSAHQGRSKNTVILWNTTQKICFLFKYIMLAWQSRHTDLLFKLLLHLLRLNLVGS